MSYYHQLIALGMITFLLSGCGNKSALYLPSEPQSIEQTIEAAKQARDERSKDNEEKTQKKLSQPAKELTVEEHKDKSQPKNTSHETKHHEIK